MQQPSQCIVRLSSRMSTWFNKWYNEKTLIYHGGSELLKKTMSISYMRVFPPTVYQHILQYICILHWCFKPGIPSLHNVSCFTQMNQVQIIKISRSVTLSYGRLTLLLVPLFSLPLSPPTPATPLNTKLQYVINANKVIWLCFLF